MQIKQQNHFLLLSTLLAGLLLAGCEQSGSTRDRILGKWQAESGLTVQFNNNGTMVLTYPPSDELGRKRDTARWTIQANDKLKYSPAGSSETRVCSVTFMFPDRVLITATDGTCLSMKHLVD